MHTETPHTDGMCRLPYCRITPSTGYADRGLCLAHEHRGITALDELPALYVRLLPMVREKTTAAVGGGAGGKFGPSVPLNVNVDALAREISWVTGTWAEIVRDRRSLFDKPNTTIKERCKTLVDHWSVFISIRGWTITTYDRTITEADGVDGVVDLIRIHDRAVWTLGTEPGIVNVPGICPQCTHPALRHRDGDDLLWCGYCGNTMPWNTYGLHVDLLAGDITDRLTGHPLL
jgi:hypothetical protein